jgi:SPP1 gp7 family putative phage head morphogenesis protein
MQRRRRLRADAEDPWRIRGRGPSPRGVIGLIRRWWRSFSRWAWTTLGAGADDDLVDPSAIGDASVRLTLGQDSAPDFPAAAFATAASPIALYAGRQARSALVRAGMPVDVVRRRLGDIPTSPFAVDLDGIDLLGSIEQRALEEWANEGVALIRTVPQEFLTDLPGQIANVVAEGGTWRTLRKQITDRLNVRRRHLELVARDQVAKLNSRVTQQMHQSAGVEEYVWRANMDSRTRKSHRRANGMVVRWDSPGVPGTGFYGEPSHAGRGGQCRCTAEPVVVL